MTFWYKGQAPDLYVKFENTTVGIHREVVKSVPYFAEIIEHHPVESKDEVVEIPMSSRKGLLYLEHIYSGHRTLEDKLEVLQSSHYFGDDLAEQIIPMNKPYTDGEMVLILNALVHLTNHEQFQQIFYSFLPKILRHMFFETQGVHLTKNAFQDIIRCHPRDPIILYGLLLSDEYDKIKDSDFKALIRKMDYSEMNIPSLIKDMIPSCSDPDYLHEKCNIYYPPVPVWVGPSAQNSDDGGCYYTHKSGSKKGKFCGRKCLPGEYCCSRHYITTPIY